jgi:hypothetical protein
MKRELAKELKSAGFPIPYFQVGHRFYPHENSTSWSEASRAAGVTITPYELQKHARDVGDGYYCPTLPDLIEASGKHLRASTWRPRCGPRKATNRARAHSAEAAVAKLWLALREETP